MKPAQVPLHREREFMARCSFSKKPEVRGLCAPYIQHLKALPFSPAPACSRACCWKNGQQALTCIPKQSILVWGGLNHPPSPQPWPSPGPRCVTQLRFTLVLQAQLLGPAAVSSLLFLYRISPLAGKNSRRPQVCLLPDLQPLRSEVTPDGVRGPGSVHRSGGQRPGSH